MGKCLFLRKGETHTAPISGILANTLAVGSTVKLMENGVAAEYLVVHQGLPSSMYDESCNGMWLLRKDIYESRAWHSSNVNDYANSTIHAYLNGDFFNLFSSIEQSVIKTVKIPYVNGTGGSAIASGASGLSTNIFLLGGYEVGFTTSDSSTFPVDGANLSYFTSVDQRVGYFNDTLIGWYLRSPLTSGSTIAWAVGSSGGYSFSNCQETSGIRPALILPSTALFDKNTLLLKGVA